MSPAATMTRLAAWHERQAADLRRLGWPPGLRFHVHAALLIIAAGGSHRVRREARNLLHQLQAQGE